jgi:Class II flagellar assembly regulator
MMRIVGPNQTGAATSTPNARRASSGTFSLDEQEAARAPAATPAPRALGGIDALIALQGIEDPAERRRRSVRRGRTALDALDELKLGLLAGTLDVGTLGRLRSAAAGLKDASGDPGLDGVMAEIELRVEVEIAKMGDGPVG